MDYTLVIHKCHIGFDIVPSNNDFNKIGFHSFECGAVPILKDNSIEGNVDLVKKRIFRGSSTDNRESINILSERIVLASQTMSGYVASYHLAKAYAKKNGFNLKDNTGYKSDPLDEKLAEDFSSKIAF